MTAVAGNPGDTGIRGTVLWGPVRPGPSSPGRTDDEPVSVAFVVLEGDQEVAAFRSSEDGRFEVTLPPGDYVLVPKDKTPIPFPQSQKTPVTVPAEGFAEITIRLDTGMK